VIRITFARRVKSQMKIFCQANSASKMDDRRRLTQSASKAAAGVTGRRGANRHNQNQSPVTTAQMGGGVYSFVTPPRPSGGYQQIRRHRNTPPIPIKTKVHDSSSSEESSSSDRNSPVGSSYALGKFSEAPAPVFLPKPPQHWTGACDIESDQKLDCTHMSHNLKLLLKVPVQG